jgi:hypothetical protein
VAFPTALSAAPWSLLMAGASLGVVFLLHRIRPDVLEEVGLGGQEVALLCLGSVAGWAANFPLALIGGTYLAVNVGGALVALLLIGRWIAQKRLPVLPTLAGTILVAAVAWRIVEFHPESGIVARYPDFFLPVAAALVFGLLASARRIRAGAPVVYTSGTLGALVGADLLHVPEMRAYFQAAPERAFISIGGAGVFDMVFLAGTFAMALSLLVVVPLIARRTPRKRAAPYPPARSLAVRDADRLYDSYRKLDAPNPLERALAGLALSDMALRQGDFDRSVRMSWLAVDGILGDERVRAHVSNGVHRDLRADVETLGRQAQEARASAQTLKQAGEANVAAKTLVASLAPRSGLRARLEGVAAG